MKIKGKIINAGNINIACDGVICGFIVEVAVEDIIGMTVNPFGQDVFVEICEKENKGFEN